MLLSYASHGCNCWCIDPSRSTPGCITDICSLERESLHDIAQLLHVSKLGTTWCYSQQKAWTCCALYLDIWSKQHQADNLLSDAHELTNKKHETCPGLGVALHDITRIKQDEAEDTLYLYAYSSACSQVMSLPRPRAERLERCSEKVLGLA